MKAVDIFLDNNPELIKTAYKKYTGNERFVNIMTGEFDAGKARRYARERNKGKIQFKRPYVSSNPRTTYVGKEFIGPGKRFNYNKPSMFDRLGAKARKVKQTAAPVGKFVGRHGKAFTGLALISGLVGATKLEGFLEDRSRQKGYAKMMMESPDLRKNKNKLQVLQFYNALWEMNPNIAKNPHTAAAFIRDQFAIGNEALHINTVSTLLGARQQDKRPSKPTTIMQSDSARNIIEGIIGI